MASGAMDGPRLGGRGDDMGHSLHMSPKSMPLVLRRTRAAGSIVLDTSAVMAILLGEDEAAVFRNRIEAAGSSPAPDNPLPEGSALSPAGLRSRASRKSRSGRGPAFARKSRRPAAARRRHRLSACHCVRGRCRRRCGPSCILAHLAFARPEHRLGSYHDVCPVSCRRRMSEQLIE